MCYEIDTLYIWWTYGRFSGLFNMLFIKKIAHVIQRQSDRRQGENLSSIDILQLPHSVTGLFKNALLHFGTFKAAQTTNFKKTRHCNSRRVHKIIQLEKYILEH
jgi:hypothetical protein